MHSCCQHGNKIVYEDDSKNNNATNIEIVKGIELKPGINNKAIGKSNCFFY
jgi:hypothetical protein